VESRTSRGAGRRLATDLTLGEIGALRAHQAKMAGEISELRAKLERLAAELGVAL
jgi:hypothetical protein